MHLNHLEIVHPTPHLQKNCLPRNQFLLPKTLGDAALTHILCVCVCVVKIIEIYTSNKLQAYAILYA